MKRALAFILTLAVMGILLSSFGWIRGFWKVEKSESFVKMKSEIKKGEILFFPPEISMTEVTDDVRRNFLEYEDKLLMARKAMKDVWKKYKINGTFFDEKGSGQPNFKQYQKLLQLRREIIQANNLQNHPLDSRDLNLSGITQTVFVNTPKINYGYGSLSKELNTPYFAISGYILFNISPKNRAMRNYAYEKDFRGRGVFHYYYCILVDVESSEIIYREFKKLPLKLNGLVMHQFLNESYQVFSKNLES